MHCRTTDVCQQVLSCGRLFLLSAALALAPQASWRQFRSQARAPVSEWVRVQVWAHAFQATAICHFIGSGSFSRALRWWARYHMPDHHARHYPGGATGWKLSDYVRFSAAAFLTFDAGPRQRISHSIRFCTALHILGPTLCVSSIAHGMQAVERAFGL